jgi:hypothetical protein
LIELAKLKQSIIGALDDRLQMQEKPSGLNLAHHFGHGRTSCDDRCTPLCSRRVSPRKAMKLGRAAENLTSRKICARV